VTERNIAKIHVEGRPATFATASEGPWKALVAVLLQTSSLRAFQDVLS